MPIETGEENWGNGWIRQYVRLPGGYCFSWFTQLKNGEYSPPRGLQLEVGDYPGSVIDQHTGVSDRGM